MADMGTLTVTLGVLVKGVQQAEASITGMLRNISAKVDATNARLATLSANLGAGVGGATSAASVGVTKLGTTVDKTSTSFHNFTKTVSINAQRLRTFGYLSTAVVTAPLIMAGKAVLNASKDYEFAIQKMVGLAGVPQELADEWSKALLSLAPQVAKAPTELAEGLYFIASSGIKGARALDVVTISAKAATAGLGETKEVADLLTSAMNAYAGTGLTASRAADILIAAVREGKGEADEFARTMGQIIPIASELGVSFEQVAGGMAAITLTGSSAANAAVYLKGLFNVLLKAPPAGEKALQSMTHLNLSYAKLREIVRGPDGVIKLMEEFRKILAEPGGEAVLSDIIPNIRALTAVLSVAGKNFKYNTELMKRVADSAGSLGAAFNAVSATIKVKLDQAVARAQVSLIELGKTMAPALIKLIEWFTKVLENFSDKWNALTEAQQKNRMITLVIAAALGPLSLLVSTVMYSVLGLANGFIGLGKALKWLVTTQVAIPTLTGIAKAIRGIFIAEELTTAAIIAQTAASSRAVGVTVARTATTASETVAQQALTAATIVQTNAIRANMLAKLANMKIGMGGKAMVLKEFMGSGATAATARWLALNGGILKTAGTILKVVKGLSLVGLGFMAVQSILKMFGIVQDGIFRDLIRKIKEVKGRIKEMKDAMEYVSPTKELDEKIGSLMYKQVGTKKVKEVAFRKENNKLVAYYTGVIREEAVFKSRLKDLTDLEMQDLQTALDQRIALAREKYDKVKDYGQKQIMAETFFVQKHAELAEELARIEWLKQKYAYDPKSLKEYIAETRKGIMEIEDDIRKAYGNRKKEVAYDKSSAQAELKYFTDTKKFITAMEIYQADVEEQANKREALLQEIRDAYIDVAEGEKYAERMSKLFGDEFNKNAELLKIYKDGVEALAKTTESLDAKAFVELRKKAYEASIATNQLTEITKELNSSLAANQMKGYMLKNFDVVGADIEAYEKAIGDLIEDTQSRMQNIKADDPLRLQRISQMLNEVMPKIKMWQENLENLKRIQQDTIDRETLAMLNAEADAFGTIAGKIEVLSFELEATERRLRDLLKLRLKGGLVSDDEIKKLVASIRDIKTSLIDLENASNLAYLWDMNEAINTVGSNMGLLTGTIDAIAEKMKIMSENAQGATPEFQLLGEKLIELRVGQEAIEFLSGAFDELFNSILEGGKDMREVMGNILRSLISQIASYIAKLLIAKAVMTAIGIATGGAGGGIMGILSLILGGVSRGGGGWNGPGNYGNYVMTAANGGIVPPGFPNDTYPALLSSNEAIIPLDKLQSPVLEGVVTFEIEGDRLVGILKKQGIKNALY